MDLGGGATNGSQPSTGALNTGLWLGPVWARSQLPARVARRRPRPAPSCPDTPGLAPGRGSLPLRQTLRRGDLVTLTGAGFAAGASITISFHSSPVVVGKAVADRLGAFSATVAVPDSASAGTHRFEAAGRGPTGPSPS